MDTPNPSVWHAGELALQTTVGAAERMAAVGAKVIRRFLLDQHREFYAQLPFVVLGSVDPEGRPWATLRAGRPGFLAAPSEHALEVSLVPDPADPAEAGFTDDAAIALLGIEPHTRRRNRLNGRLRRRDASHFAIEVGESFGNCPKYIQQRDARFEREPDQPSALPAQPLAPDDARIRAWVARADTFFVASYVDADDGRRVDVSHRGGRPGFVRVEADGSLLIPDFPGNQFFSTLGNLLANPRAGLVFPDFEHGHLLQLSGRAQVQVEAPEPVQGAERYWRFTPEHALLRPEALALRFASRPDGVSPATLAMGIWPEAPEQP